MYANAIPAEITSILENDFKLNKNILFCQIATIKDGLPHVRTVRLYGIEDCHGLIFLTRTTSRKWQALMQYLHLSICLLHPEYRIQLQAECTAKLVNVNDDLPLIQKYWSMIKDDVKKIYHPDYLPNIDYQQGKATEVPTIIPDSCGMIIAMPYCWEYLLVNDNYPESKRYQFTHHPQQGWIKSHLTMS